jgi:hypothetical protein
MGVLQQKLDNIFRFHIRNTWYILGRERVLGARAGDRRWRGCDVVTMGLNAES